MTPDRARPGPAQWATTAAIALVFGLAGALAAGRLSSPSLQPPPQDERASFREKVDALLADHMTLSPDQKRRVAVIDHDYTVDYNLILADLHASNAELGAALADDMSLSSGAKEAISEVQLNVGQMQTATVQYILNVRAVLTPAQQQAFDGRIVADIM